MATDSDKLDLEGVGHRAQTIAPESFDPETFRITATWFSTPERVVVDRKGTRYIERLEPAGCDMTRLTAGVSILWAHAYGADPKDIGSHNVIGGTVPGSATSPADGATITLEMSNLTTDQDRVQKIVRGYVRGISIGYTLDTVRTIAASKETQSLPVLVVEKWTPYEVSVLPVQADVGAMTRSLKEVSPMEDIKTNAHPEDVVPDPAPVVAPDLNAIRAQAKADADMEALNRLTKITNAGRAFGKTDTDIYALVQSGKPVAEVLQGLVDEKIAAPANTAVRSQVTVQVQRADADTANVAMAEYLGNRAFGRPLTDQARAMYGRYDSLTSAFRAHMIRTGRVEAEDLSDAEIAQIAYGVRAVGPLTPADLPVILDSSVSRELRLQFENSEPDNFGPMVLEREVKDFKTLSMATYSMIGGFAEVPAGSPGPDLATHGEAYEEVQTKRQMARADLSYHAQKNDDLSMISDLPRQATAAARELRHDLFWAEFLAGTVGGTSIFHSTHSNITAAAGAAPSVEQIAKGRLLLRKQTNASGRHLNLAPTHIIVPPALEGSIDTLVTARMIAQQMQTDVPDYIRSLSPVVEARLGADASGGSDLLWYMFAGAMPAFVAATLTGMKTPVVRRVVNPYTMDVAFVVDWAYAVKALDYRSLYRNKGAA